MGGTSLVYCIMLQEEGFRVDAYSDGTEEGYQVRKVWE